MVQKESLAVGSSGRLTCRHTAAAPAHISLLGSAIKHKCPFLDVKFQKTTSSWFTRQCVRYKSWFTFCFLHVSVFEKIYTHTLHLCGGITVYLFFAWICISGEKKQNTYCTYIMMLFMHLLCVSEIVGSRCAGFRTGLPSLFQRNPGVEPHDHRTLRHGEGSLFSPNYACFKRKKTTWNIYWLNFTDRWQILQWWINMYSVWGNRGNKHK